MLPLAKLPHPISGACSTSNMPGYSGWHNCSHFGNPCLLTLGILDISAYHFFSGGMAFSPLRTMSVGLCNSLFIDWSVKLPYWQRNSSLGSMTYPSCSSCQTPQWIVWHVMQVLLHLPHFARWRRDMITLRQVKKVINQKSSAFQWICPISLLGRRMASLSLVLASVEH